MSWLHAAAALAVVWLTGCAALQPAPQAQLTPLPPSAPVEPMRAADAPASAASAAAAAPALKVVIDAPDALKELLQKYLDIVRLGQIARDDVDSSEWSRLVDATPAQARTLLQTEGYFAAHVSIERTPGAAGAPEVVTLHVEPGERARIAQVRIEAEGDLERAALADDAAAKATLARLRSGWLLPAGQEFRNAAWSSAKAQALAQLRAAGYATATWSGTSAEVDTQTEQVSLFAVVDSGPLFRFGELEVDGLAAHDVETVNNVLNLQRGVPVTETVLLDFQERLRKAGLFEAVSVTLDTDPARAANARIIARLREAPLQTYTFGVGVSANTGPRASVEQFYRRVFGYPLTMHNKIEYGKTHQYWEGELSTHPGRDLYRNLIGTLVDNLESDSDVVLSQRVRVGRTQDTQRIERLYYLEVERSRRTTKPDETVTNAFALSLNYHGTWRELDSVVLPTRGFSFAGQAGIGRSHGTDAEPGIFERAYGRLTVYVPFGRTFYGQARLELGQVFLKSTMVVPDSQKFRAGGDESVRGYSYRSLGPIVDGAVGSGNVVGTTSIEVARPISSRMPALWGAVFVDAGNAANSWAEFKPEVGYGLGVRWRSPVGPLRVDWAWAAKTHKGRLHFSVGIAF